MVALSSLASRYVEAQHKTYLDRLEKAIEDPRNRNIALSGPYGTGKSSVLDKFEEKHKGSTLRLAVSTLAPDTEGVTLTNRIQKEVLKQLIYSTRPSTLRHSRFSRQKPLSRWRALLDSVVFVGVVGTLLALLGYLPSRGVAAGPHHSGTERALVWAVVAALFVVVFWVLRIVTYDRIKISEVSAAGTKLTLSTPTHTYFDDHLDEIVYFFDHEPTDFVLFEDLDRYNDPQIFQALRELNTLLNNTTKRRRKHKKPLRFIYAMRDSLFEKIGKDTAEEGGDAARAETVRANRTKFFEVVIPVVPFISHRTARDHLHQLLLEVKITGIDRRLIELVAENATDMRLLLNMRNEYLVFAERLLHCDKVAPQLSASHLFALVAYKNFHLEDFEDISRRASDLDRLYDHYRELVATSVANCEQAKRDLLVKNAHPPGLDPFAKQLGIRLIGFANFERDQKQRAGWQLHITVGSTVYNPDDVTTPAFWEAVVASRAITFGVIQNPGYTNPTPLITLSQGHLEGLFPDALQGQWEERNTEGLREELQRLDSDIEYLRRADFKDLVNADRFTIVVSLQGVDEVGNAEARTFGEVVDRILKSNLARDLVKQGYIDRNFTLYAAQFYGEFTGADVATFVVQTVQTRSMDINYQFTSPGACANLLAEADEGFTRTTSAYNIQLVEYLLAEDTQRADEVVKHLTSNFGRDAQQFLTAFFTSSEERTQLAARLSRELWEDVFTYLTSNEGVPADVRTACVDAAVLAANPDGAYDLSSLGDFVISYYKQMSAFTQPHPRPELDTVVTLLQRAKVLLPSLNGVDQELRTLLVDNNLYTLTADNLRTALDATGAMTLDRIFENDTIYQYCLSNLAAYLETVEADDETNYSTLTTATLVDALAAAEDDNETLARLTATASPDSSLLRLTDAPQPAWPKLASAKLFHASLVNLDAYRANIGDIDENLGGLLLDAGVIYTDTGDADAPRDADTLATAAVAVLNARRGIPRPEDRIRLVNSLGLEHLLLATQITPEESNLFALLLKDDLVPDDIETFTHLRGGGWTALGPAIVVSNDIKNFLTPNLVDGMIADLFDDLDTSRKIGPTALAALADFLPTDDDKALAAAARFAIKSGTVLPVDQIRRIAATCKDADRTVRLLKIAAPTAEDIVAVLSELGDKYSYLTTWEHTEFEVPDDDAHKTVFRIIASAGLCHARQKPRHQHVLLVKQPSN